MPSANAGSHIVIFGWIIVQDVVNARLAFERRRRSRRSVRDVDPGPDAAPGARQRILAFANLVCTVAVFREPGPRSVKEAVAECDRVEVRGTKEPLLNLLVG